MVIADQLEKWKDETSMWCFCETYLETMLRLGLGLQKPPVS
jgi:hypothetical protein